jgi:hypothetical protein
MLFAEISDTVWLAIVAGIFGAVMAIVTFLSTITTMVVKELLVDRPAREAQKKEVREVKETAKDTTAVYTQKLDAIASDGKKTLHLCNSAMEEQKRMLMVKCEAAAKVEPTAVNIAEATAAREAYEEHKAKQQKADQIEAAK